MNDLKTSVSPWMKPVVAGVPAFVLIALALALPLALWALKALKARAARRKEDKAKVLDAPPVPPPRTDRLLKVWKRFLKQLSPTYRRSILQFQPILVMGPIASGKSLLIDACSDWRRLERQQAGGHLDDPSLQISLASQLVLLELPHAVLQDNSRRGRTAMLRLCRALAGPHKPLVVVTLDVMALGSLPTDTVRELADRMRGKLNLLAEVYRSPIEVRVTLTHLDQVRGYAPFARLLDTRNTSAVLALKPEALGSEPALEGLLRQRFTDFEKLLPWALQRLSSEDHLEVVAFLREGPTHLPAVAHFIAALCTPNPRTPMPVLERVYLAAPPQVAKGANPLYASPEQAPRRRPRPLRRHRMVAVAGATLGALYLVAGYLYERKLWKLANHSLATYGETRSMNDKRLEDLDRFSSRRVSGPMRFFPSYFSFLDERIEQELSQKIQQGQLERALEYPDRLGEDERPHLRGLYLLAVLYATRDNNLGRFVLEHPEEWQAVTRLSPKLLKVYVHSTATAYAEPRDPERMCSQEPGASKPNLHALCSTPPRDATNDMAPWLDFFQALQAAYAQGSVEPREIERLQQEAITLQAALKVLQRYRQSRDILRLLEVNTTLHLQDTVYANALPAVEATAMFGENLPLVSNLLSEVGNKALLSPQSPEEGLLPAIQTLNGQLRTLLDSAQLTKTEAQKLEYTVGGKSFTFATNQWKDLLRASTTSEQVRQFVSRRVERRASIFFTGQETLASLELNPLGEGGVLFPGKASVEGRYTRVAFDQYVRAPLATFEELADKLQTANKLSAYDRTLLDGYIRQEVGRYARAYADAMDTYYQGFTVRVDSIPELQLLLKRMQADDSIFIEFLQRMGENTALELGDGVLLKPLREALAPYAPLQRIVGVKALGLPADKKSGEVALSAYRDLLGQLYLALAGQSQEGAASEEEEPGEKTEETKKEPQPGGSQETEDPRGLTDRLSPAGRLALDMILNTPSSYDTLFTKWLKAVRLNEDARLMRPFLAPVDRLRHLGRQEIEETVAVHWRTQILPELTPVLNSFPFDRESSQDATPQQLQALFHPLTGRFHQRTRQLIEPFSRYVNHTWKKRATQGGLVLPEDLYATVNNVQRLTHLLWDAKGNPSPLHLRVATVPFETTSGGKDALATRALPTLALLYSGSSTLVNFNQRPTPSSMDLDWTRLRQAKVAVETIDRTSGAKQSLPHQQSEQSYWGLLRLLRMGTQQGSVWTWSFPLGLRQRDKGERQSIAVRFEFPEDPWAIFDLHPSESSEREDSAPMASTSSQRPGNKWVKRLVRATANPSRNRQPEPGYPRVRRRVRSVSFHQDGSTP